MISSKGKLLSTSMIPLVAGAGIAIAFASVPARGENPSATAKQPAAVARMQLAACNPCNPCAAKKGCNPCNPCAAKKACNPCNPCAAKGCNPCNPCAAKGCNPCNPCSAGGAMVSKACVVPRLAAANPCAAKKGCNPCNPCAAKKMGCNPCNPCAAKKMGCNPCNPCAAKKMGCNPCNPCAAKKMGCNPCNPCAAKKMGCNPCNPCAAKKACNPCNPCAASNPCNPCNPCGGAAMAELSNQEAAAAYDCIINEMLAAYAKSGHPVASAYAAWRRYNIAPYQSETHGGRFVSNYANPTGKAYGAYEDVGRMPAGAILAKDSFSVTPAGGIAVGPLFLMEKMDAGFNAASGDWRYTMITPDGTVVGTTNGKGSNSVAFCYNCHMLNEDTDSLWFIPDELRVK